MNSFLKELAIQLYNQYQAGLSDITLVFPNRRAGLFFRKHLSEVIHSPVWAPGIVSMEDFINGYSELQIADNLTLIFLLYDEYLKVNPKVESFDRFYSWGEIMLKDFDDIDKYLINSDHLFTSIKELKELEARFDYLTKEQIAVIKSFWSSFGANPSSQQQGFLTIWELLPKIYKNFRERLAKENIAYEGLIYRAIAEKTASGYHIPNNKKIIFAGFNSLSTSEERIIKYFINDHKAEIVWDVDRSYIEDPNLEAGIFLRRYYKDKIFGKFFPTPLPVRLQVGKEKKIEIIGVPLAVGQAKKLGDKLANLIDNRNLNDLTKTVVVLPEEVLLFPVLHSLPGAIADINVTMGYPLKDTSLNSFFEHLLTFQQQESIITNGVIHFHHKSLLSLLKHPLFLQYNSALSIKVVAEIEKNNIIYVPSSLLKQNDALYSKVFRKVRSTRELLDYLIDIILIFNQSMEGNNKEESQREQGQANDVSFLEERSLKAQELEKEYIYQFYALLNRLKAIIIDQKI
ncbi:MAG: PD-(D/E)XK nuclease family protein, partial [Bacteroidota bacterium]|nr:PD-(D/E)XK nuclease family protein [Bacteroidota bacterium]